MSFFWKQLKQRGFRAVEFIIEFRSMFRYGFSGKELDDGGCLVFQTEGAFPRLRGMARKQILRRPQRQIALAVEMNSGLLRLFPQQLRRELRVLRQMKSRQRLLLPAGAVTQTAGAEPDQARSRQTAFELLSPRVIQLDSQRENRHFRHPAEQRERRPVIEGVRRTETVADLLGLLKNMTQRISLP